MPGLRNLLGRVFGVLSHAKLEQRRRVSAFARSPISVASFFVSLKPSISLNAGSSGFNPLLSISEVFMHEA